MVISVGPLVGLGFHISIKTGESGKQQSVSTSSTSPGREENELQWLVPSSNHLLLVVADVFHHSGSHGYGRHPSYLPTGFFFV